jgi:histidinol-phosphatase (PHP family)
MPFLNYHSHSYYCDGKASPEDFVKAAVEKGFPAYGFSSHAPVPFTSRWNMEMGNLPVYLEDIAKIKRAYSGIIEIYTGLEVDYIDGIWGYRSTDLGNYPLDFYIGSVHYIGRFPDGSFFCFDGGQPDNFFKGIEVIYQNDFRKAITTFYQAEMQMVENEKPDVIGHMDKIKMHNAVMPYLNEQDDWYVGLVEDTLDIVQKTGCIVEVNTRGLYKHNPSLLYPAEWILKRIYLRKIPVLINSDSHYPTEIDLGFVEVAKLLKQIGFRTLRVLLRGKWQDVAFDETGIII